MLKKFSLFFIAFVFLNANNCYVKFHSILNNAKLQCPTSHFDKTCSRHYGDFNGFENKYFYYENNNLVFYMCGNHKRSELRFKNEFFANGNNKILEAEVKLFPKTDEFTFLQIHTLKDINKPILRVALYKNHLKLFVFDGKKYIKKDLGSYNFNYINFKIIIGNNLLKIYENKKLVYKTKIYYKKKCYFKAGVYLQRNGCAKAEFKKIRINF